MGIIDEIMKNFKGDIEKQTELSKQMIVELQQLNQNVKTGILWIRELNDNIVLLHKGEMGVPAPEAETKGKQVQVG